MRRVFNLSPGCVCVLLQKQKLIRYSRSRSHVNDTALRTNVCLPYVQVELLEMRVETALIQQTIGIDKHNVRSEATAWARLFDRKYIDRTLIGILMMFFQRKLSILFSIYSFGFRSVIRMERDQRIALLWSDTCEEHWSARRYSDSDGVGWNWDRPIYCCHPGYYIY